MHDAPPCLVQVGDEISFFHNNKTIEGFVIDIGWYRTNVRSWEREVYVIPNAVFSKVSQWTSTIWSTWHCTVKEAQVAAGADVADAPLQLISPSLPGSSIWTSQLGLGCEPLPPTTLSHPSLWGPLLVQNIVLNVSRKHREWRFYEVLCMRVQDINKVSGVLSARWR
jgi:hypothetical protein